MHIPGKASEVVASAILSVGLFVSWATMGAPRQATSAPPAPKLEGRVWKWTKSFSAHGSVKAPDDPNRYRIEFSPPGAPQGAVFIMADCNRVTGTYRTDGSRLTITPGATTRATCSHGSAERDYLRQLEKVGSYLFKEGALMLEFGADSGTMMFMPGASTALSGSSWSVSAYNSGGGGIVSVDLDIRMTLTFGADGKFSGNGGCNEFTGAYENTETALKITPVASTYLVCAASGDVMGHEAQYFNALANSVTYSVEGSRLTIRDAAGAVQVLATR